MNHKSNKINWQVGDVVIHDADAKTCTMLMKVVKIIEATGLIKTVYINRTGNEKFYLNRRSVLHDPRRFDIEV